MAFRREAEQLVTVQWKSLIPIVEDVISKFGTGFVQQVMEPIMDDWISKIKDEILSAVQKKLVSRKWNSMDETTTPIPRDYKLKFLDQVSDPVFTGMEIKGKEGTDIKVALVDNVTEDPVDSGLESSAMVEILFLNEDGEDFNKSIIIGNNNPHFHKPINVNLEKGIGILPKNVKLGHNSNWIKCCKCRLGARVVQKIDGSRIKEALTESFTVLDKRSSLYKKCDKPSLLDDVWRLKYIGKNGVRHLRLQENKISTVQRFRFLLSVDPQRLRKIYGEGRQAEWRGTVDHACTCDIDDKKIYLHYSSSECKTGVVFDVVGRLKGVLRDNRYVPIESVAEAEKDDALKSLSYEFENQKEAPACKNVKKASAFENWNNIISYDDEASFLRNFPCTSNDRNATNSIGLDGHFGQYHVDAGFLDEVIYEDQFSFDPSCPLDFEDADFLNKRLYEGPFSSSDPLPPLHFEDSSFLVELLYEDPFSSSDPFSSLDFGYADFLNEPLYEVPFSSSDPLPPLDYEDAGFLNEMVYEDPFSSSDPLNEMVYEDPFSSSDPSPLLNFGDILMGDDSHTNLLR